MSDKCIVCGKATPGIQSIRTAGGAVCRECAKNIPQSLQLKAMSASAIRQVAEYEQKLKDEGYDITASYGKLMLDELRGLVFLADKTDNEKNPLPPYEIYDLSDVKEIGLYPTNPHSEKGNVYCDVEFSMELKDPPIATKRTVRTNVKCNYKPVGGLSQQVEWSEPGDLTMFRNILNQCIETAVKRSITKQLPSLDKRDIDLFRAEAGLYLHAGYTEKEISDHAQRLMNAFSDMPDSGDYAALIQTFKETADKALRENYERSKS